MRLGAPDHCSDSPRSLFVEPYQISLLAQRLGRDSGDRIHEFGAGDRVGAAFGVHSTTYGAGRSAGVGAQCMVMTIQGLSVLLHRDLTDLYAVTPVVARQILSFSWARRSLLDGAVDDSRVKVRFYIDPATGQPHIHKHDVAEFEVEEVVVHPGEDRVGREGARVATGRTATGRLLRVIYVPDQEPGSVFVITAYGLRGKPALAYRRRRRNMRP